MTEAVIVSTARTGLARSWKGSFNATHGASLGGFAVKAAMERAGIDPGEVEDVVMGCATPIASIYEVFPVQCPVCGPDEHRRVHHIQC